MDDPNKLSDEAFDKQWAPHPQRRQWTWRIFRYVLIFAMVVCYQRWSHRPPAPSQISAPPSLQSATPAPVNSTPAQQAATEPGGYGSHVAEQPIPPQFQPGSESRVAEHTGGVPTPPPSIVLPDFPQQAPAPMSGRTPAPAPQMTPAVSRGAQF